MNKWLSGWFIRQEARLLLTTSVSSNCVLYTAWAPHKKPLTLTTAEALTVGPLTTSTCCMFGFSNQSSSFIECHCHMIKAYLYHLLLTYLPTSLSAAITPWLIYSNPNFPCDLIGLPASCLPSSALTHSYRKGGGRSERSVLATTSLLLLTLSFGSTSNEASPRIRPSVLNSILSNEIPII